MSFVYDAMRVIECRWMSRRWCINLFGVAVTGDRSWISPRVLNHENIHTAQQRELLYVPFYLLYALEWVVRMVMYRGRAMRAYEQMSFEREAYANDANPEYLAHRRRYAWLRYVRSAKR